MTYGLVRRDHDQLADIGWGLVVADEAQHVKNPLSRTARDLRTIPAAARIALTGTPVENRLTDLWAILDWTTPGLLGPLEAFRRGVAVPVERYRDSEATDRLGRLTRPFLLRRRKSDPGIAPELPRKTETDQIVGLSPEQATLYEAVVRETLAQIENSEGIARRGLVLKLLTALKQICNHPAQYLHQPGPLPGRSGKLAVLDELLDITTAAGDSVLVFSQYVAMHRLIEAHLNSRGIHTLFLHGGVPTTRREQMVADFQSGAVPVFLLSVKAGGVGLNLTRATHVIHFDRWWNPAVEDQATDRAYRIGQDRPVQVHRLITEGTLEDKIATLLASQARPRRGRGGIRRGLARRAVRRRSRRARQPRAQAVSPSSRWPAHRAGHRKPAAKGPGSRRGFGATWWGAAWVDALQGRASLDPNRLPRGRSYSRSGAVGELTVAPGEVRAAVQGSRARPYDVHIRVRQFDDRQWARLLDIVASQVGHAAALLDGELPPRSSTTSPRPASGCCPGPGICNRAARARTRPIRASTPRRSASSSRTSWTPTRSRCSCFAAATVTLCCRHCAADAAARSPRHSARANTTPASQPGRRTPSPDDPPCPCRRSPPAPAGPRHSLSTHRPRPASIPAR